MEYTYNSIVTEPLLNHFDGSGNLDGGIMYDVPNSAMTDKTITRCHWSECCAELIVYFENTLDAGDEIILDGIVADNT